MALGSKAWKEFAALRDKYHEEWSLTTGYRTREGKRFNFAAKRIISRSRLGDPHLFQRLSDLKAFLANPPEEEEALPPVIQLVIPEAKPEPVKRRVRRRA